MPNPSFAAPETNPFGLTDVGFYSSPAFADLDKDGDQDAFVGEYITGNIYYFQNTGTASSPKFATRQTNPFGLMSLGPDSLTQPTFADLDNDGDLDAYVGDASGNIAYFKNIGTASSPSFDKPQKNPFGFTDIGSYSSPAFADLDKDGDLDAYVGDISGNIAYFKNTGTASSPSFAAPQTNPFGFTKVGSFSMPTFGDLDQDGDLDAFVGDNNGNINYFQNTGTASSPSFAAFQTNPFGLKSVASISNPTFADLDNDGDLDAYVGDVSGNITYFKNGPANTAPTDLSLSPSSINENVAANSSVGTFSSTDPDTGNTFTYSLVPGTGDTNNSAFSVASNQLRINASPDFETKSSYNIRVRTTDQGGLTYEKSLVVNINDIDESISGTPNNDVLNGTASADQIKGLAGSDIIYGKAGNDIIDGGDGDDIVYGGNDRDLLRGGNGSDRLYGDAGNDELLGEEGDDILYGGDGDDLLNGGAGSDRLYGNAGIDTFVLASGMGLDSIYNFQDGIDRIRLDGGLTFGALQIAPSGTSTLIKIASTGETLASLVNINSALIGAADFS